MFDNLNKFEKRIAIEDENLGCYSYKDLLNLSNNLKNKIHGKNICMHICSNNLESILGYIAFMRKPNLVTLLVDQTFKKKFIDKIIRLYKPQYIFASNSLNFNNYHTVDEIHSFNLLKSSIKFKDKIEKLNYLLLPTSGTTQSPKFVRLSKKNLLINSKQIIKTLKIKKNHTTITTMPMGYSYGLSIINTHLLSGAKIVLNKKTIFEAEFWNKIFRKKINSFGGVPEFYDYLKKIKFGSKKLISLKYITQAGGRLDLETINYLEKVCRDKKIKLFKMYGQTEASPRISILEWRDFLKKKNSVGRPLNGISLVLINDEGKKIEKSNAPGEILVKGDNVCLGYANSIKDLSKKDINKKKLFTGDIAYKDKDGFIYIVGRKKRIIKIFGIRMDMDDIENHLKKNKIICKCRSVDKKLVLKLNDLKSGERSKEILSNYLGINKNYIIAELNDNNNFKKVKY